MTRETGLTPRFAAWRILHDVRLGVPFDLALSRAIVGLEPDDRRLAHQLAAGVFRMRTQLDGILEEVVSRGVSSVKPDTLDVLRIGVFQLRGLDRIPPHAAVQTTVEAARRVGGEKVAGFVNAVLRRVSTRPAAFDTVPTDLAAEHSHPPWLVDRWVARHGEEETARRLEWNNTQPPLILQPARWPMDRLLAELDAAQVEFHHAPYGAGVVVSVRSPTEIPGFEDGGFVVQDSAQRLVAEFCDPGTGVLYDACASPGGKTVALASRSRQIIAADRTRARVARLRETVERAAAGPVWPIRADASAPPFKRVDAVLLDVPCLGTGTLARNPDARWRVSFEALGDLAAQARRFLLAAAEIVAPGGLLLFATCSLEPEENELQIDRFLAEDARFRREPSEAVPADLLSPSGDLMLLPEQHGTDGAYAARLRKLTG